MLSRPAKHLSAAALALSLLIPLAMAADKKDVKKVDQDSLTGETQKSAGPTDGFNVVWWVPIEFWQTSLTQDTSIAPADAEKIVKSLDKYLIIGVVRADVTPLGTFKYHDAAVVERNINVVYTDKDGTETSLVLEGDLDEDAKTLLDVMKPILNNAMGRMGENFHFLVYKDRDNAGKRVASPYEKGKLTVTLKKISNEAGGTVEFECPLNSLYVPRECTGCKKQAHISWNFCPWCGKQLSK